jgi:DNA-binding transcriptional MerR regulator
VARRKNKKRLYYKIGEACKQLDIQPYVLRYWETEFPALSPDKSKSGQRVYSEKELEIIRRIKQLLYEEGYTIAGAKKKLEAELAAGGPGEDPDVTGNGDVTAGAAVREAEQELEDLRQGLQEVLGEARELLELLDAEG